MHRHARASPHRGFITCCRYLSPPPLCLHARSEVPALLGARHTLESVEVVMTEAPVMNYNQGSPPFTVLTSVLNHLVRRGGG